MPERHRSWYWPLALAALFVATFGVALFLSPRDDSETEPSAAVAAANMRKHGGKPASATPAASARDSTMLPAGQAAKPAPPPDDGVDRRSLSPDKGPDYLPEPNEGKD